MNELHLFAGAGGGILGGMLLGHTCVCAVEIEPYPRKVLLQRQRDGIIPPFPIWDDIRTFDGKPWKGRVDAVCGGFPCQGFSSAASRGKKADNLWPQMLRVVGDVCPRFVFCENVSDVAIREAQADLESCGFATWRARIDAEDVGADHPRKRFWLFADANGHGKLGQSINGQMAMLPACSTTIWESEPDFSGIHDGVASKMDRCRAIGNGQVPAVAALAWKVLSK